MVLFVSTEGQRAEYNTGRQLTMKSRELRPGQVLRNGVLGMWDRPRKATFREDDFSSHLRNGVLGMWDLTPEATFRL